MRPGVLDIGRGRYRAALGKSCAIDIDVIERQFWPGAGIEYIFGCHGALSERGARREGDCAGKKRSEGTTVDHGFLRCCFCLDLHRRRDQATLFPTDEACGATD